MYHVWYANNTKKKEKIDTRSIQMCKRQILSELLIIIIIKPNWELNF